MTPERALQLRRRALASTLSATQARIQARVAGARAARLVAESHHQTQKQHARDDDLDFSAEGRDDEPGDDGA